MLFCCALSLLKIVTSPLQRLWRDGYLIMWGTEGNPFSFFLTRLLNGSILLLGISGFIPTFTFLCLNGDLLSYLD